MTIVTKKLYSSYDEVAANQMTDQVPVLQGTNKKTTLQKIYYLFKANFDSVYQTAAQVATQISNALTSYYTAEQINTNFYNKTQVDTTVGGLVSKLDKDNLFEFDLSGPYTPDITGTSGVITLTNITGGEQDVLITFSNPNVVNKDFYLLSIKSTSATRISLNQHWTVNGALTISMHVNGNVAEVQIGYLKVTN